MLKLPPNTRIYLAVTPIDMRRSFDGLCAIVMEVLQQNPMDGHLFLFCGKGGNRMKALIWDRNGFVLWYKRLEKGRFKWPRSVVHSLSISELELALLMDGIDFTKLKKLPVFKAQYAL